MTSTGENDPSYSTMNTQIPSSQTTAFDIGSDPTQAALTLASQVISKATLVNIMISMGCAIDLKDVKETFRHPAGFFIGMLSQFVLMPLVAFALALALRLETAEALSLLIMGCCPGGTLSNMLTYWVDGDVCLSVSMTAVSSTAAIGMMPLNLFIYSRMWTNEKAVIPYVNIVITLVSICVPLGFGILLRFFKKTWAEYITKIGSVTTWFLIAVTLTFFFLLNPTFYLAPWGIWFAGTTLPFIGYAIGFFFALLFRQTHTRCLAIAFETGSQNLTIAMNLTYMTFSDTEFFLDMLLFPTLYAVFIIVDSALVISIYRACVVARQKRRARNGDDIVDGVGMTSLAEPVDGGTIEYTLGENNPALCGQKQFTEVTARS